jgi:hypothetical protein
VSDDLYQELPREEALIRLYEVRDRLEKAIASRGVLNPRSESERAIDRSTATLWRSDAVARSRTRAPLK